MTADRGLHTAVGLIAAVAIFTAAYLASSVFAPVALAFFIIAMVWPLQSRLQSRLPKLIALAIVMLVTVAVFMAFASLVVWGFGRVARGLISDAARFQLLYEQALAWLDGHGIALAGLWAEHFNVRWLMRAVQETTGRVSTTMSFWLVVLVYVMLGLLEVDDAGRKVQAMANRRGRAHPARRQRDRRRQAPQVHAGQDADERDNRRCSSGPSPCSPGCSLRPNGASSPSR